MNKKTSSTTGKASNKKHLKVTGELSAQENNQAISQVSELSEDMEVVSPGTMLSEAREVLTYSQDHIASKLNFTLTLVKDIENDSFNPSIPATFIRGYLTNYAKLVNVDVEEVLASYDTLGAANTQLSEMLSFSKQTSKQAEHSRVMWLSYLIVAVLIGLTILWWQQENSKQAEDDIAAVPALPKVQINEVVNDSVKEAETDTVLDDSLSINQTENKNVSQSTVTEINEKITDESITDKKNADNIPSSENTSDVIQPAEAVLSSAVFTFEGDCYVNIFDATGERIAYGTKKLGYVMTIQGVAPLRVTLGKPELTSIIFNGLPVDMSTINLGNIATFNLPIGE